VELLNTYAKVPHGMLYTIKTPSRAADLINDRVLPFCQANYLLVLGYSLTVALSIAVGQRPTIFS
jgi:hypothetical protein